MKPLFPEASYESFPVDKEKRFLLTKDAKHFMDDRIVPFKMLLD